MSVCLSLGVLSGLWGVTGQAGRRGSPNLSLAVRAVTVGPPSPKPRSRACSPAPHPSLIPEESRNWEVGQDDVDTGNGQQLPGLSSAASDPPAPCRAPLTCVISDEGNPRPTQHHQDVYRR